MTTPILSASSDDHTLGAQSPQMRQLWARAARVAPMDATVLITGESGVGKEVVARWLHHASRRAQGPFVPVNCGAFADTLLESELFGHVRGAFTGAVQDRVGVFEAAHGGTLFLDEIGDVPAAMQVKLLRVIQEREVRRVGETKTRRVDIRLIAATHRDLREDVAQHRFRADLFYRLCVIDLHVPPLRERPEDLQMLARAFVTRAAARQDRPIKGFTRRALDLLLHYPWPGNVRELEHALERACAMATGVRVDVDDLPEPVRRGSTRCVLAGDVPSLHELELQAILTALQHNQGNQRRTAAQLGISTATLTRRLRAYRHVTSRRREGSSF